jgi:hypothetical protein
LAVKVACSFGLCDATDVVEIEEWGAAGMTLVG